MRGPQEERPAARPERDGPAPEPPGVALCVIRVEVKRAVRRYRVATSPDVRLVPETARHYTDLDATMRAVRSFLEALALHTR